jgi:hypothetical protein
MVTAPATLLALASCGGSVVVEPGSSTSGGGGMSSTTGVCETVGEGCCSDADCPEGEWCEVSVGLCYWEGTTCQQCACQDLLSMGGCADRCKKGVNGTNTPDFCDGVSALPQCAKCLQDHCSLMPFPPDPTEPSSCL